MICEATADKVKLQKTILNVSETVVCAAWVPIDELMNKYKSRNTATQLAIGRIETHLIQTEANASPRQKPLKLKVKSVLYTIEVFRFSFYQSV